ncbi:formin homology 2 domain-containing protein [Ditylenchus destructor]|nr:formin homology 2 domain-containing protein [Ditylenchus destructor]
MTNCSVGVTLFSKCSKLDGKTFYVFFYYSEAFLSVFYDYLSGSLFLYCPEAPTDGAYWLNNFKIGFKFLRVNGNVLNSNNDVASLDRRTANRRRQLEAEEMRQSSAAVPNRNKFEHQNGHIPEHNNNHNSNGSNNGLNEVPSWRTKNGTLPPINGDSKLTDMDSISDGLGRNLNIDSAHSGFQSRKPQLTLGKVSDRFEDVPEKNGIGESIDKAEEKENIQLENGEAAESHQVKAPPPLFPTNLFSPTEKKTMDFPEPEDKAPEPPAPEAPKPKHDSDDDDAGASGGGFAALLQKRAKKMESGAFRKGLIETSSRQSESEVKWKQAAENIKEKPLIINDLDFSDFVEFEQDPLILVKVAQVAQERGLLPGGPPRLPPGGVPPAPPPIMGPGGVPPPPPAFGGSMRGRESSPGPSSSMKAGGTLKLHWKPAQAEAPPVPALMRKGTFWKGVDAPQIDTTRLSKLFEQKPKDAPVKKTGGESKPQVLQVLSVKRSQAINIGLTKLPPISVIPTAIKKFDASVLNKEGIEKILGTMMPHAEEIERMHEKMGENPETPLGQAEQFLLSLSEIDCLLERLKLWLFMLDYQNLEKDVAESLMELNNAMKEIEESKTFRVAMGMLLTIGNALNGTDIKAFQLDYLSRVSEFKDPVHKYPLTHHLSEYMLDHYPEGTDLYSEFGAVSRSSRIDFDAVLDNLKKMEVDCKASFDYVGKISQKDNNSSMKNKVNVFLTEVAERIHRLKHVHRTTIHRWNAFLLYFGYSAAEVKDQKPSTVFKMVIEFSLEYRTNRDKILQMRKRMAEKRERNKTRGIMISAAQAQSGSAAVQASPRKGRPGTGMTDRERHQEMSRLLTGGTSVDDTLTRRKAGQPTPERTLIANQAESLRKSPADGESQEDELLDGVVRTVTAQAESRDHNRRRARLFNRKSLRRTRTIRQDQLTELNMNNY